VVEQGLKNEISQVTSEIAKLSEQRDSLYENLGKLTVFRDLLFENGKPLERAIIQSLEILGFEAKPFDNGKSEFDVVFESKEGRLIGEAEGKDNKPVNIDKLRQLQMNIHEDFQRDEVLTPAKGVLFGNPFRLLPPSERMEAPFTEKCLLSAGTNGTALVTTYDLFLATKSLLDSPDEVYAARCREALVKGVGLVMFPTREE